MIELGTHGLYGVATCYVAILLSATLLVMKLRRGQTRFADMAPVLALAVIVAMYALDGLPNSMHNPIFVMAGGAVVSTVLGWKYVFGPTETGEKTSQSGMLSESVPLRQLTSGSP